MTTRKTGRIVGEVSYRPGDGVEVVIPRGACEVDVGSQDVTISWHDGETSQVTAIPFDLYTTYLSDGLIAVD